MDNKKSAANSGVKDNLTEVKVTNEEVLASKKATETAKKTTAKTTTAAKKTTAKTNGTAKKTTAKTTATTKKTTAKKAEIVAEPVAAENIPVTQEPVVTENIPAAPVDLGPRRSVAFIGSECYPFAKTGGLGDVMSALPKSLAKLNLDVKVILPRYKCIPWKYQEKMEYRGSFYMNLCADGRQYYVGIMEYQEDGVVYDFIDNDDFFSWGNPYTNLIDDIPKFCFLQKHPLQHLIIWTGLRM